MNYPQSGRSGCLVYKAHVQVFYSVSVFTFTLYQWNVQNRSRCLRSIFVHCAHAQDDKMVYMCTVQTIEWA